MRLSLAAVPLLAVLAATSLAGCGDDGADDGAGGEPAACPSYADVTASADGTTATQTFVVTLDLSLARDAEARRALFEAVSEQTCLLVTEAGPAALDAVLVDTGIPLDAAGQQVVEDAVRAQEGTVDVEPTSAPDPL